VRTLNHKGSKIKRKERKKKMVKRSIILCSVFVFMLAIVISGCGQQLKQENEQLKGQVQALTDDNNNLQSQIENLIKERDDLKAQVASLTQERDNLKKEIEAAKAKAKPAAKGTTKKKSTRRK